MPLSDRIYAINRPAAIAANHSRSDAAASNFPRLDRTSRRRTAEDFDRRMTTIAIPATAIASILTPNNGLTILEVASAAKRMAPEIALTQKPAQAPESTARAPPPAAGGRSRARAD